MLKDKDNYFKREWASLTEINDSPNTSSILFWENRKAVLRSNIIYLSYKKKGTPHSINPTEPAHSELQKYKLERNGLVNKFFK